MRAKKESPFLQQRHLALRFGPALEYLRQEGVEGGTGLIGDKKREPPVLKPGALDSKQGGAGEVTSRMAPSPARVK